MAIAYKIWTSTYADSVALMTIARDILAFDGVDDSALVMATDSNKALLEQVAPLTDEVIAAKATDLILMLDGDETQFQKAIELVAQRLSAKSSILAGSSARTPKSLRSALRTHADANLALISVPGEYAAAEAWKALQAGLHVLLFSDNVSLNDEKALKEYAVKQGLFVMGSGAGTAIINGVGLGFSNKVPRGNIGIVSASGTGLQEVTCLLARFGSGISQAIGLGGRDLRDEIGGLMTTQAIQALQDDDSTQVIIAISKLPSTQIAEKVINQLAAGTKPAVVIFMSAKAFSAPQTIYIAQTLHEAALLAHALSTGQPIEAVQRAYLDELAQLEELAIQYRKSQNAERRYLRGLFSGGTLCEEAMRIWTGFLGDVWSNAPLEAQFQLSDSSKSYQHSALDLGEEEFTHGRPHPMIDNQLRIARLYQEANDPSILAIQLDVVLGYGAHTDPAGELCPAIAQVLKMTNAEINIIVSITGTEDDPQDFSRQKQAFISAGAIVLDSNAQASTLAARIARITANV